MKKYLQKETNYINNERHNERNNDQTMDLEKERTK